MYIQEGFIATTHRDSYGHKFTKEDLQQILDQIKGKLQPIFRQHRREDGPVGKIIDAKLKQMEDGEYGIFATAEIYDVRAVKEIGSGFLKGFSVTVGNDQISCNDEMRSEIHENSIILEFNKHSYKEQDIDTFINETSRVVQIKKQPLIMFAETSPIIITLVFLPAFFFMKGFFTKMGERLAEDSYRFLKEKLINLVRSNIVEGTPTLAFNLRIEGTNIDIRGEVATNDTDTINLALDSGKELYDIAIERITKIKINSDDKIRVISYKFDIDKKSWKFSFAQTDSLKEIK